MAEEHQTIRVVAAVIEQDGTYLITQRRKQAALPLLWEFPGGKVETGEDDAAALAREIMHRLGVSIGVGELISFVTHPYDYYTVELYLYACHITSGEPEARAVHDFHWATSEQFEDYNFTPADESSMSKLLGIETP